MPDLTPASEVRLSDFIIGRMLVDVETGREFRIVPRRPHYCALCGRGMTGDLIPENVRWRTALLRVADSIARLAHWRRHAD